MTEANPQTAALMTPQRVAGALTRAGLPRARFSRTATRIKNWKECVQSGFSVEGRGDGRVIVTYNRAFQSGPAPELAERLEQYRAALALAGLAAVIEDQRVEVTPAQQKPE